MPTENDGIKIDQYVDIVLRWRWMIILPLCIALVIGIVLCFVLPKQYVAQTMILVEPQRVPQGYVKSVVTEDIDSRINTISQQIMSRTNLEKIIDQFKLFSDAKYQNMYLEDKLEDLRKRINVKVTRARSGADAFTISFQGEKPEQVMQITNTLTNYFIDENLKLREDHASGTKKFLEDELNVMERRLKDVEENLKDYKRKYMGELPEQLETNLRILDRLQAQLSEREMSLRDAKNRLTELEGQMVSVNENPNDDSTLMFSNSDEIVKLNKLKEKLAEYTSKYTEKHPDVVKLKNEIKELEKRIKDAASKSGDSAVSTSQKQNPLIKKHNDIKNEIAGYADDVKRIKQEVSVYEARVEATPKREQELISLKRNYKNMQEQYQSLLQRKYEAEIAVNMEMKQKGEQFRIVDSAKLPEKPVSPNLKLLLVVILALGLGSGGGVVFVFEFLSTPFRNPDEVESTLDLPVLATIPKIYSKRDKMLNLVNQISSVFSLIIAFGLLSIFVLITLNGTDLFLLFLRKAIQF